MTTLLSEAGRSFLRAFGVTFLLAATGFLSAPNLSTSAAVAAAAIVAAIAAGIKSVQSFVPALTFSAYLPKPYGAWVDAFLRAFIASILAGVYGLLTLPNLSFSSAVWFAVLQGALVAGVRALQGLLTTGDLPAPTSGIQVPGTPERPPTPARAAG